MQSGPSHSTDFRQRPNRSPVMIQHWRELLFLHWEFPGSQIQATLPPGLTVDTFEGRAFIAVIPFYMKRVRPAYLPAVGSLSNFLELNVRTYVVDRHGRPGVWFYSLVCNQPVAVRVARRFFHLPYQDAELCAKTTGGVTNYFAKRQGAAQASEFIYQPDSPIFLAEAGTLEYFLAERYLLFAYDERRKRLHCGRVHHVPYPLSQARLDSYDYNMLGLAGFKPTSAKPTHVMMSAGVDVSVYGLEEVTL